MTPRLDDREKTHHPMNTNQNRSHKMYLMNEDLARAHMAERMEAAQQMRVNRQQARARRMSRRADRAARQARRSLADAL